MWDRPRCGILPHFCFLLTILTASERRGQQMLTIAVLSLIGLGLWARETQKLNKTMREEGHVVVDGVWGGGVVVVLLAVGLLLSIFLGMIAPKEWKWAETHVMAEVPGQERFREEMVGGLGGRAFLYWVGDVEEGYERKYLDAGNTRIVFSDGVSWEVRRHKQVVRPGIWRAVSSCWTCLSEVEVFLPSAK